MARAPIAIRLEVVPTRRKRMECWRGPRFFSRLGGVVHIHNNDFRPAIAVDIANRQAARGPRLLKSRSGLVAYVREASVAEVPVEQRLLQVPVAHRRIVHFRINMPVGQHDILPAIFVDILKAIPQPNNWFLPAPPVARYR